MFKINFIFLFLFCRVVFARGDITPADVISKLAFEPEIKVENLTTAIDGGRFKDSAGNVIQIKTDTMNEVIAKKIVKNKLIQLKLLFAPQTAAYPGMLTRDQHCQDTAVFSHSTKETENSIFWFSEMPGADDFTYGSCGSRSEPYWSQYLLIYCKNQKTTYDVRYFKVSKNKDADMFKHPIAKCK